MIRAVPALQMKDPWRYAVRHPLRRASQEGWQRWGNFFGTMKLKMGSVFPLVREDLALAAAVLYNLDRLVAFFPRRPPAGWPLS